MKAPSNKFIWAAATNGSTRLIAAKQAARAVRVLTPSQFARQAGAALSLGNFAVASKQLKVLNRLDDYGYFSAGPDFYAPMTAFAPIPTKLLRPAL